MACTLHIYIILLFQTTSRIGWQSPQDTAMSPKSDHYPYRNMVKSTTSPKIVPIKSSCNNLEVANHNQYSKSVDSKLLSPNTMDSSLNKIETSNGYKKVNGRIQMATTITTTSYAYLEKSPETGKYGKYSTNSTIAKCEKGAQHGKTNNTVEVEFHQPTKLSKYDEFGMNREFYGKSQQSGQQLLQNNKNDQLNCSESNYGKILPTKCFDSYNANIQTPVLVARTDNSNYNNNNYNYNQCNNNIKSSVTQPFPTKPIENYNIKTDQSGNNLLRCRNDINRSMLRTNRYSSSNTNSGGHQLSHVINSLSSPESAYSTGYSTDGTSPGKYFSFLYISAFLYINQPTYQTIIYQIQLKTVLNKKISQNLNI